MSTAGAATAGGPGGRRGMGAAVAAMFSGTLVSRLLGFVRTATLLIALGSTGAAGASFTVANNLPNTIYMLLAGGVINAVLVPQLVRAAKDPDGGQDYANRLLTVAGSALLAVTAILTFAAPLLVRMYAVGLSRAWLPIAFAFAYWCIPQVFFYGLYTLLGQVLNARSVFGPYMWAPVLNNLVALGGLAAYLHIFGAMPQDQLSAAEFGPDRIVLLGATATLGVAAQALVLIIPLWRSGFRYRPAWGLQGLRSAGTMGSWTFGALLVGQLSVLAVSNIAAAATAWGESEGVAVAGNQTYGAAFTVFMLPQSLIVVSLITAMFTHLSERAAAGDRTAVRSAMSLSVRTAGVFTILAAGLILVLANPLARAVTLGRESAQANEQLGLLIGALAIGIPGLALWSAVQRVYFAYQDARTPFWIQVPMMGIVVIGAAGSWLVLPPEFWVFGACLAMSLSYTAGGLVGFLGLRRRLGRLDGTRIFSTYFRLTLAIAPAIFAGILVNAFIPGTGFATSIAQIVVMTIVMTAIYLFLAYVLHVEEVKTAIARLRGMFTRLEGPVSRRLSTMGSGRGGGVGDRTGDAWVLKDAVTSGMLLADRFEVGDPGATPLPGARAWQGRDTILERPVEIISVGGPNAERVLDGARRASMVTDHRVPRVLRVGEHAGSGYVILEPVAGTRLDEVRAAGPLPSATARSIVGEVASALEAGRRRGVHHLALEPAYITIDDDGGVHLAGLGLAAAATGSSLAAGDAGEADAASAVALYSQLTGQEPPEEVRRSFATPANVVVALAPWAPVPGVAGLRGQSAEPAGPAGTEKKSGPAGTEKKDKPKKKGARAKTAPAVLADAAAVASPPAARKAPKQPAEPEGPGALEPDGLGAIEAPEPETPDTPEAETPGTPEDEATSATPEPEAPDTPEAAERAPGAMAAVRAWLRRVDEVVPAERVLSADEEAPFEPPDAAAWSLTVPEEFAPAPAFGVVVDPDGHGPYGAVHEPSVSASAPDGAALARHGSGTAIGALAAWWEGRRELWEAARAARQAEAAVRAEEAAQKAAAEKAAAAVAAAEAAAAAEVEREAQRAAALAAAQAAAAAQAEAERRAREEAQAQALAEAEWDEDDDWEPQPEVETTPLGTGPRARSQAEEQAARDAAAYQMPTSRPRTWGTINATPIVLIVVLAGVLWVAYLAINSLIAPIRDGILPLDPLPAQTAPVTPGDTTSNAPEDATEEAPEEAPEDATEDAGE